jgi:ABC-type lipoprotein export system ATPase subunit
MSAAIEVRDLFRVHSTAEGDAAALQGLSLRADEREIVAVLGPSGSGKTTFLRILAGLDRPSAGSVRVFGAEVGKIDGRRLAGYRASVLGYADQHYARALAPELRAHELIGLPLGLRGVSSRPRRARAAELLERVGLSEKSLAFPGELSGGEQQRIAVCAALAHRPRLLLADEPTGELDAANARIVYELIGQLVRENRCTAIIVSHDPNVAQIADRLVSIRDGRVSEESRRGGGGKESIVVGRGGWIRLPDDLLARAGIRSHATARFDGADIVVSGADRLPPPVEAVEGASVRPHPERPGTDGLVTADLSAVSKTYEGIPPTPVLSEVSASFAAALLHVVTGPSGSGKTTLLHLLAGLDKPTAGEVRILGETVSELDRAARARFRRRSIAYVGQQLALVPYWSARENVQLAIDLREVRGLDPADALEAVGLAERATQRVSRLSTGERVRVAIARALATGAPVVLADEPTSRLDQANALVIAGLFVRLARERGVTIICATHDPVLVDHADAELPLDIERGGSPE